MFKYNIILSLFLVQAVTSHSLTRVELSFAKLYTIKITLIFYEVLYCK